MMDMHIDKNHCTPSPRCRFLQRRRTLCRPKLLFFISLFLLGCCDVKAQQGADYAVHANIVYHFTKYINWPDDKKSGDFVIGIVGETPLYDVLKSFMVNKTAGNHRIVVKKIPTSTGSCNCQILFVSDDASGSLKRIVAATADDATLLVTESDGLARKGSCINFIIVDDRLKLEINKANIEKRGLDIASDLLKLGILVK